MSNKGIIFIIWFVITSFASFFYDETAKEIVFRYLFTGGFLLVTMGILSLLGHFDENSEE